MVIRRYFDTVAEAWQSIREIVLRQRRDENGCQMDDERPSLKELAAASSSFDAEYGAAFLSTADPVVRQKLDDLRNSYSRVGRASWCLNSRDPEWVAASHAVHRALLELQPFALAIGAPAAIPNAPKTPRALRRKPKGRSGRRTKAEAEQLRALVRQKREDGLSNREISDELGISEQYVSEILAGHYGED